MSICNTGEETGNIDCTIVDQFNVVRCIIISPGRYLADDYKSYFDSFEKCYSIVKNDIVDGCSKKWVGGLADELDIDKKWRRSNAFYRKVLDGVLMTEGGRSD